MQQDGVGGVNAARQGVGGVNAARQGVGGVITVRQRMGGVNAARQRVGGVLLCPLLQEYEHKLEDLELTLVEQLKTDRSEIIDRLDQQKRVPIYICCVYRFLFPISKYVYCVYQFPFQVVFVTFTLYHNLL